MKEASCPDIADSEFKTEIEKAVAYRILIPNAENSEPDAPATHEFAALTASRCTGYSTGADIQCEDAADISCKKRPRSQYWGRFSFDLNRDFSLRYKFCLQRRRISLLNIHFWFYCIILFCCKKRTKRFSAQLPPQALRKKYKMQAY